MVPYSAADGKDTTDKDSSPLVSIYSAVPPAAPAGSFRYSYSSRPCHRGEINLRLEGESGQVAAVMIARER